MLCVVVVFFCSDLYSQVYELSVASFGIVYLAVTVFSAALLTLSYRNVESGTNASLANLRKFSNINHKKYNLSREQAEQLQEDVTVQESQAWAFFVSNLTFVLCFLFFAFYMFRSLDTSYNYMIAMIASSAITWQLSASVSK